MGPRSRLVEKLDLFVKSVKCIITMSDMKDIDNINAKANKVRVLLNLDAS